MFFFLPIRDEYKVKKFPAIVLALIIINAFIFFYHGLSPEYYDIVMRYGFIPNRTSPGTLLSANFLHGGLMHLGFNMWYLWLFGNNLEDRWGGSMFLLFYLFAGIFSMLLYSSLIPSASGDIPTIGASGAVAGVLGAYAVLFPKIKITFKYFIWLFIFFIRFGEFKIYAYIWLALWFLQESVSTLLVAKEIQISSVAFGAHFAGFVFGMVVAAGSKLYREAKFKENIHLGENVLFNMLGAKPFVSRTMDEYGEIEGAKSQIALHIDDNVPLAGRIYDTLLGKYPEAVLPEKIQYQLALSLDRMKAATAETAYKNFLLEYPFSKLSDAILINMGKLLVDKGDIQKAKYAFLQIVLFYPYSQFYDESKYYLEKKLPKLNTGLNS